MQCSVGFKNAFRTICQQYDCYMSKAEANQKGTESAGSSTNLFAIDDMKCTAAGFKVDDCANSDDDV